MTVPNSQLTARVDDTARPKGGAVFPPTNRLSSAVNKAQKHQEQETCAINRSEMVLETVNRFAGKQSE